ncbi:hypothetical protein LZ30DRAFT_114914 [Colletotrichum cereale]|nr:hypothetical protein LZ30DRAFT_114914 [Colletotrichum cereale]
MIRIRLAGVSVLCILCSVERSSDRPASTRELTADKCNVAAASIIGIILFGWSSAPGAANADAGCLREEPLHVARPLNCPVHVQTG